MATVTLHARTDTGLVRTNNEDSYFTDPENQLAIVADGMGGHAAGEVASKITVDTISGSLKPQPSLWPFGRAQRERTQLFDAIRHITSERDCSVVFVEQYVSLALEVADSVTILNRGSVVLSGLAKEIAAKPQLLEDAYLGAASSNGDGRATRTGPVGA